MPPSMCCALQWAKNLPRQFVLAESTRALIGANTSSLAALRSQRWCWEWWWTQRQRVLVLNMHYSPLPWQRSSSTSSQRRSSARSRNTCLVSPHTKAQWRRSSNGRRSQTPRTANKASGWNPFWLTQSERPPRTPACPTLPWAHPRHASSTRSSTTLCAPLPAVAQLCSQHRTGKPRLKRRPEAEKVWCRKLRAWRVLSHWQVSCWLPRTNEHVTQKNKNFFFRKEKKSGISKQYGFFSVKKNYYAFLNWFLFRKEKKACFFFFIEKKPDHYDGLLIILWICGEFLFRKEKKTCFFFFTEKKLVKSQRMFISQHHITSRSCTFSPCGQREKTAASSPLWHWWVRQWRHGPQQVQKEEKKKKKVQEN